jgi:hypothetical protein
MRQAQFPRAWIPAPSQKGCSSCAVVWTPKRTLPDQFPSASGVAGNRVQASDFQGFLPVQRREQ